MGLIDIKQVTLFANVYFASISICNLYFIRLFDSDFKYIINTPVFKSVQTFAFLIQAIHFCQYSAEITLGNRLVRPNIFPLNIN